MNDDKATGLYTEFEGKGIGATEIGKDKPILSDFELPRRAATSLGSGFTTLIKDSESIAAQMDDSITDIVNTMGQGKGFAASMRANIAKSVPEIVLMGGEFSDVEKIAVDTLDTLGRNVQLNEKEYEQIFATTKITGESTKNLQEAFANSGKSIKDIAKEMFDVVNIANSLGANAKAVSKDVVANMQQLNRFGFEGGINGLAKMAAQASILRIDMGEVFQFAEDAMSPEKAIEFSSALQRLGAVSSELVDPLKLMDLSQNNVPQLQKELGTLFKQYAKFDETTKQFKIAPGARLTLKQLEQDLGIPLEQIEKMAIASADMERKMKDIDLSQFALDEETATLVTSMAKMGEGGEYVIETKTADGDPIQKSIEEFVSDLGGDSEAIKKFVQDRKEEEGKSIDEQILERAEGQLSMLKSIDQEMKASSMAKALTVGGGELGANMLKLNEELVKKITEPAIETFGPNSGLYKAINKTGKNLDDAIELLKGGNTSKLGGATKEIAKTMALTGAYGVDETFGGAEKLFDFSPLIQTAINGIQTATNQALNVILQTAGITPEDQITFKQQVETKDALISTETDSSIIVVNELGKIGQVLKPDPQDVVGVMPKEGMNQFMDAVDKPKVIDKTKEANNYTSLLESESLKNNINISNQTSNQNLDYVTNLTNNVNTNYENLKRTLNSFAENLNKTTTINYNTNNTELKKTQNVE